jgi:hypothetical protein
MLFLLPLEMEGKGNSRDGSLAPLGWDPLSRGYGVGVPHEKRAQVQGWGSLSFPLKGETGAALFLYTPYNCHISILIYFQL